MRRELQVSNWILSNRNSVFSTSSIGSHPIFLRLRSRLTVRSVVLGLWLLIACTLFPQSVKSNPLAGNCTSTLMDWHNKGTGVNSYRRWIDPEFPQKERDLIEQALRLAVNRLQEKRNWEEIQERFRYSWVTSGILSSSRVCDERNIRLNLLFNQLYWLSLPNAGNDTTPAFPDIYISKGYEQTHEGETGWVASAPYNTVKIYWEGQGWRATSDSKFVITLNTYYVAGPGVWSKADYWAGTIAHEMMHNLGHRHPDISDPNYLKYQINVVDEVIQNDGYDYKGSRRTLLSLHSCRAP